MTAILPCDVSATCESEENFVDQCGRLKRMVWPLATHVLDSYLLKVRINQRDKSVAGRSVTVLHLFQQECDLIRLCFVVWIDIFPPIFLTPTRPHFSQSRQIHHNIAP